MKKASVVMSCTVLGIAAASFVVSLLTLLQKERRGANTAD